MNDPTRIRAALSNANAQAFMHVIWKGETGDRGDADYRRLNVAIDGRLYFDAPPWVHPWAGQSTTKVGHSTAAGRPQFLGDTWAGLARQYPDDCADFSPPAQDFGTLALIAEHGALEDVLAGRFDQAVLKCRKEWSSLPGASENNPKWTLAAARDYYITAGGQLQTVVDAPEETAMPGIADTIAAAAPAVGSLFGPLGGLVGGLAAALINGFAPLAQEKISKEVARHTDNPETVAAVSNALTSGVVQLAQQITHKDDPVEAVLVAKNDPAIMQQIEQATLAKLDELAPFLDKLAQFQKQEDDSREQSMDHAAARASAAGWDMSKPLVYWALACGTLILVGLFIIGGIYAYLGKAVPEMLLTLIVQTVTGILGFIALLFGFRYGTSRSSGAKDELVAQLAARRPK